MEGYISSIIFLVRGSSFAYAINALPINVCRRILLQRRSSWPVERVQELSDAKMKLLPLEVKDILTSCLWEADYRHRPFSQ